MKPDPKVTMIRELRPFAAATEREIRQLCKAGDLVGIDRGEVVCRADSTATESFVVVEGNVDVLVNGKVVATLPPGEVVGELSLLDGKRRSADIVAATDVTLLAFSRQTMRALMDTNDAMRQAVMRQLAQRLRRADDELAKSVRV